MKGLIVFCTSSAGGGGGPRPPAGVWGFPRSSPSFWPPQAVCISRGCRGTPSSCRGLGCSQLLSLLSRECRGTPSSCRGLGCPQILSLLPAAAGGMHRTLKSYCILNLSYNIDKIGLID